MTPDEPTDAVTSLIAEVAELTRRLAELEKDLRDEASITVSFDSYHIGLYAPHGAELRRAPTLIDLVRQLGKEQP